MEKEGTARYIAPTNKRALISTGLGSNTYHSPSGLKIVPHAAEFSFRCGSGTTNPPYAYRSFGNRASPVRGTGLARFPRPLGLVVIYDLLTDTNWSLRMTAVNNYRETFL